MESSKTRKIIIWGSVVLLVAVLVPVGLNYYKKYVNSNLLAFEIDTFKFSQTGISKIIVGATDGWTTADLTVKVKNFSTSKFTVNSLKIDIYTMNDTLIASQNKQLPQKVVIMPNSDKSITIGIDIQVAGIVQMLKQLQGKDILTVLKSYYTTGLIGTQLKLKGSFTAEGLTIVNIPLDETIDI